MSVSADFRIDVRPYSGYEDPALPIAAYIGQGSLVGDASGGSVDFSFLFQRSADAQISEMFNLEQLAMDSTTSALPVTIRLVAMDTLSPSRLAFGQIWSGLMADRFAGTNSALPVGGLPRPLWLGSPNREEGNGLIRFTMQNFDLDLYAVTIQGYMWGPRSVLAPGGPQRPVGRLFGG